MKKMVTKRAKRKSLSKTAVKAKGQSKFSHEDEALVLDVPCDITKQKDAEGTVAEIEDELELGNAKVGELHERLIHEVSERKRLENELSEYKKDLESFLSNTPMSVVIISEDTNDIVYANRVHLDVTGYESLEELLAVPLNKRLTAESYAQALEMTQKRRLGKRTPKCFHIDMVRKDGEVKNFKLHTGNTILWNDKKYYLAFLEDRTEQVRMEEALRNEEALVVLLLSQIPCRVWTTDTELKFITSIGADLAGLAGIQIPHLGMDIREYYQIEDDSHPALVAHRRALKGGSATFEIEQGGDILDCRVEPLRDIAGRIIGVVGAALDITDTRNAEARLRALAYRLIEVQEEERRIISRELHDELGQSLTVLQLMLARAAQTVPENASMGHNEAQELVRDIIARVRRISLDLGPSMLDDLGLLPTLLDYFKRQRALTKLKINFKYIGLKKKKFPMAVSNTAYRFIQEALTNVIRHAGTDSMNVLAWADHKTLIIRVEDGGSGFAPSTQDIRNTGGLQGIRERVRLLGGRFEIESAPHRGTCLIAELPLPQETKNQGESE